MRRAAEQGWERLPVKWRESAALIAAGSWVHRVSCRFSQREQSESTWFLRNEALLLTIRDLVMERFKRDEQIRLCVVGCSTGAEMYSILCVWRKACPNLNVVPIGIDISEPAVSKAEAARYTRGDSEIVRGFLRSEPKPLPEESIAELFETSGNELRVKDWIRRGANFQVADARDPELARKLGFQDVVVANNFLVHMKPPAATACLWNVIRLVRPGGILVCRGVDLDVRERAVRDFGLTPVILRIEEIHDSELNIDARRYWPWRYFGLEPLNKKRKDWMERYASIFRVPSTEGDADPGVRTESSR